MDRELDQTLQRNLERLYNYLENPEREEAQRVLLAAEPEPIRITHGIPDLYTDWLSSPSYSAQGGLTGQLTQVISQTVGRPVLVFDDYFKVHEVTIRTVAETGGANSISVSDLQVQLNQQINTFIQDRIDGDKADKVSRLQSNISYLIEMGINIDFTARHELPPGGRGNRATIPTSDPNGESGVTIGYGFDVGQHDESGIQALNIAESTRKKIRPALGLKGANTATFQALAQLIPVLTDEDGLSLFTAKMIKVTDRMKVKFQQWSTLPPAVKTIVTDLYYHYGEYSSFPNFETAISQSDWPAAIRELRNWNGTPNSTDPSDGIARRLNNRADYLQRSLGL